MYWGFKTFRKIRLKKLGWNGTIPVLEMSSHKSDDLLLLVDWKGKFENNFFRSAFTITDYGACSVVYPYLDFENPKTQNLTKRNYDGLTLYNQVNLTDNWQLINHEFYQKKADINYIQKRNFPRGILWK